MFPKNLHRSKSVEQLNLLDSCNTLCLKTCKMVRFLQFRANPQDSLNSSSWLEDIKPLERATHLNRRVWLHSYSSSLLDGWICRSNKPNMP